MLLIINNCNRIPRLKFSSLKQLHNLPSVGATYKKFVKDMKGAPPILTFWVWVNHGTKFATFAGAGECYHQLSIAIPQLIFFNRIYLSPYAYRSKT
jgi:hypothetical protein